MNAKTDMLTLKVSDMDLAHHCQPGLRNAEALQSILVAAGQLVHTIGTKQIMLILISSFHTHCCAHTPRPGL